MDNTMLIQLTNQKAAGLLHELEELHLIKVLKENYKPSQSKLRMASWIRWADERKRREDANVVENTPAHSLSRLRVVAGDVRADLMEVCNRRVRPDYLEVHAVAHESTSCSTSSRLFERPAAMSARPRRMEAMMCNSSVISSSDATSGSVLRASVTACLSVMGKDYGFAVPNASGA